MSCDATVSGADPTAMRRSHGMMKERFNSRQLSVASPRRSPAASYCFLLGSATSCKTFFFKAAWTVLHPEPQLSFSLFPLTCTVSCGLPSPKHMQQCLQQKLKQFWRTALSLCLHEGPLGSLVALSAPARALQGVWVHSSKMQATPMKRWKEKPILVFKYIYLVSFFVYSYAFLLLSNISLAGNVKLWWIHSVWNHLALTPYLCFDF